MGEKFLDGERLIRTAQERIEVLTTALSQVRSIRDEYSRGKDVQITMGNNLAEAGRAAIKDILTQEAIYAYNAVSGDIAKLTEYFNNPCEFQKSMRMKVVKSVFFHRSGCEYIQEWMRMVSENTKEDANGFGEGALGHCWANAE